MRAAVPDVIDECLRKLQNVNLAMKIEKRREECEIGKSGWRGV